MRTKQTIAVISATEKMGEAFVEMFSGENYRVLLLSKNKNRSRKIEKEMRQAFPSADVECISCSYTACWEADIIIIAVPVSSESEIANCIKEVANQKIVISINIPSTDSLEEMIAASGNSAAEELQMLLPNSKVVKVFNTNIEDDAASAAQNQILTDAFITGDDKDALVKVGDLIQVAGFNPIVAGDLATSRVFEQMQVLLRKISMRHFDSRAVCWKILHD